MNIKFRKAKVFLLLTYLFRKTFTANICGHKTKQVGPIKAHDDNLIMTMPLCENGKPDYCLTCIEKMAIKCAWCGKPIPIGAPITLKKPKRLCDLSPHIVRYHKDEAFIVGCLRSSCSLGGMDRCGFWVPPGKVERVPSPIDILMSSPNNQAVFIQDLSDPTDLGKLI